MRRGDPIDHPLSVLLLFLAVGVAYWQYGGGLSLMPAFTADYFGSKNLGFNYGLVFIGWGVAFFVPQLAGYIKDMTGSLDYAFYLSGGLLAALPGSHAPEVIRDLQAHGLSWAAIVGSIDAGQPGSIHVCREPQT